ncbi:MAG: TldD/PmbA family protein [Candidatus Heimdallarchaeota archaeon]|nr:TldD/PmbA family protein [Candidatus Heimdallarchaeota archaeon]MCK4954081.1 TldD/PmbA family protein [Candidatus Heimdallarchaeota archaeon]
MFSENFLSLIDYTKNALESSSFDSYEINCVDRLHALTRFANSTIHQNVSDHTYRFLFRVSKGKKFCSSSLTTLTPSSIDATIKQLDSMLSFVPEISFFQGFPESIDSPLVSIPTVGNLLDEFQRADIVETSVSGAEEVDKNARLAGSVYISDIRFRVLNSNGIDNSHQITYNGLIVNSLTERENKGYAKEEQHVRDPADLKPYEIARQATELSVSTCSSKDYSPGEYEVVLSPSATTTLMRFLSMGFSGNAYHESQSFVADQIGVQLFDQKLTLQDDPLNPETLLATPFDGEGVQKKPLFLIEEGIPKTIIYNNFMASRYLNDKSSSTGHQIIPFSDYIFSWVMPMNLTLYPGDSSLEEMIEETKKGFFVNRLHYTNFVNRRLGAITGLTRDGLLYIEDGEVVSAAKNFRFTDNIPNFLKEVPLIGENREKSIASLCPAIKLKSFRFSGKSKH